MKKWLFIFGLLLTPVISFAISPIDEDDNVVLHYKNYSVSASTDIILIDLSDIATYGHKYTGNFVISEIDLTLERVQASTGCVKIGVVNYVGASTGSVTYFYEYPMYQIGASTDIVVNIQNHSPSLLRLKAIPSETAHTDGSTPYIYSNDKTSGSTSFQNDVVKTTSMGDNVYPALGDIILTLTKGSATGSFGIVLDVHYHSKR